jgi:uncharacterized protein (TIGR02996 family)
MFLDDETALRNAAYANLADDAPWLILADWYRDHGNDRMADRVPELRQVLIDSLPVARHVTESSLHDLIRERHHDVRPRLMLAEWLDEHGRPDEAEMWRFGCRGLGQWAYVYPPPLPLREPLMPPSRRREPPPLPRREPPPLPWERDVFRAV